MKIREKIAKKIKPTGKSSKRQLETESIKFLKKLESKEIASKKDSRQRFGSWEDRLKKMGEFKRS
jgi:hypothetical protein